MRRGGRILCRWTQIPERLEAPICQRNPSPPPPLKWCQPIEMGHCDLERDGARRFSGSFVMKWWWVDGGVSQKCASLHAGRLLFDSLAPLFASRRIFSATFFIFFFCDGLKMSAPFHRLPRAVAKKNKNNKKLQKHKGTEKRLAPSDNTLWYTHKN